MKALPTEDELAALSPDEIKAIFVEVEQQRANNQKRGRFNLFKPFAFQREWYECDKKIEVLLAGNQVGKTTCGAIRILSACLGVNPPSLGGKIPAAWSDIDCSNKKFLAAGKNFSKIIPKSIIPKLKEFLVPEMMSRPPRKNSGHKQEEIFYFKSGSELHIQSYEEGSDSFESAVWDGIWLDEPPPEDIFVGIARGAMAKKAPILITATPIKEPWMFEAFVAPLMDPEADEHSTMAVFRADIHMNCLDCHGEGALSHEEITNFLKLITNPAERIARERGEFLDLAGIEFSYVSRDSHVCPDLY